MKEGPVKFFATEKAWRAWLEKDHASADELWVGFYKKASGKPSITWPEAVDGALCFGWIDGLRKSIDEVSYKIRFTPRRPTSTWCKANIARVPALEALGLMTPAGRDAFAARKEAKSGIYSYEQRDIAELPPAMQARFEAFAKAWASFQKLPPGYRKTAIFWVMNAKQEATRERRLTQLIADSAAGRTIKPLTRPTAKR
jgi:uncharacterized protein YdeI (YjbR/CyaY-like superfamily)